MRTAHQLDKKTVAFGAPGIKPHWTASAKDGIGTAYHTSSRLWFTLSHGIVNEVRLLVCRFASGPTPRRRPSPLHILVARGMGRKRFSSGDWRGKSTQKNQMTNPIMNVLAIDTGGTHVKILAAGKKTHREFSSGPTLTARRMVAAVKKLAGDWKYDVVSIGYPGLVIHGRPVLEPHNLGPGWVGFDFAAAFKRPVKVINDAAMQALGNYKRGKMLFLGLGTGLGSAMIVDGSVVPMELAHLPYKKGTYEDYAGIRGLKKHGKKRWRRNVVEVVKRLSAALEPDDVVLGKGNVKKLRKLPPGCRTSDNAKAFIGGFRLWANADGGHRPVKRKAASLVSEKRRTPVNQATG